MGIRVLIMLLLFTISVLYIHVPKAYANEEAVIRSLLMRGNIKDIQRTWKKASIYIPPTEKTKKIKGRVKDSAVKRVISSFTPDVVFPAVVYLHGCAGIKREERADAKMFRDMGYVVIMPNSFARKDRKRNCDPRIKSTWPEREPRWLKFRRQEIAYALQQLRLLSWIDQSNIFLAGFSEGGTAVALYYGQGFAGHIITGWTCVSIASSGRATKYNGIRSPLSVPILAIVASRDPWYSNKTHRGNCGEKTTYRSNVTSVIIDSNKHWVNNTRKARLAIERFLQQNRQLN